MTGPSASRPAHPSERHGAARARLERWTEPALMPARVARVIRITVNVIGATGAAYFLFASVHSYFQSHRAIGVAFVAVQLWVVVAYLVRRPASTVTRRPGDWALATVGTFGGVLVRPDGLHPGWGTAVGLGLQVVGLAVCVASFLSLGRSFGFAAADRGLRVRGPYAVVRHPIYASYLLLQLGYLSQSLSWRNAVVFAVVSGANVGRAGAEERVLAQGDGYDAYRARVRWRFIPGVW